MEFEASRFMGFLVFRDLGVEGLCFESSRWASRGSSGLPLGVRGLRAHKFGFKDEACVPPLLCNSWRICVYDYI